MIIVNDGVLIVNGKKADIITEATIVLRSVYHRLVEEDGEDAAAELFAEIGRIAVMDEESIKNLGKES